MSPPGLYEMSSSFLSGDLPRRYVYRPDVLAELLRHGVVPTERSSPEMVRGFVRELYKFELRRLKERLQRREFPRAEYAGRVDELRRAYPVLARLPGDFVE